MRKVARNTGRQGQTRGQLIATVAKQHSVSQRWLRLVAFGSLDDPACVQALQRASKVPKLWALVAPAAKDALFLATSKAEQLGGSRDDLLAMLLDALAILRHPDNQNYARQHTALDYVNLSLDLHLEDRDYAERDLGRRNINSTQGARGKRTEYADVRGKRLYEAVENRGSRTKGAMYQLLADKENATPGAIKKSIRRYIERLQPHSN